MLVYIAIMILVALYFLCVFRKREHYGGAIKGIRKIPIGMCKKICDGYYQSCMASYGENDAAWCAEQFLEACPMECYYSKYQRF
jgi:hypothetical protein